MRTRIVAILGLSVLVGVAAVAFAVAIRGGNSEGPSGAGGRPASRPAVAGAQPVSRAIETAQPEAPFDDDPPGSLRLEGQVIDHQDRPVGDATVVIDANPPREVRTEADGSFAFDQLTPRAYRVAARSADGYAGPVAVRLGQRTEPVVLRIRASGRLAVTVSSDAGAPVRGALVELRDLVSITAITDDAGRALLRGVGPGWHIVKASADGYAAALRDLSTTGDAGAETQLAIVLRAGASAAGCVVDASGRPIEGARLVPEHLGQLEDLYDGRLDAVITDAKGRWRVTGLPRATVRIRAYHTVYAPGSSAPLVLSDGDREGVTIVLERGGRVRGRVVDAAGAPVPGAEVRISADTVLSGQVRRVATDASGAFELAGLPRRLMYAIAASDGATSKIEPIELAGPEPAPIELALAHGAELTGVVVTSAGVPVAEARIDARPATARWEIDHRLRGSMTAIAGMDGRFRISGLEPGSYQVRAIRPGSSSSLLQARMGVSVQTGTDARIEVDDLSAITGKVALPDGKPVTQFSIQLGTATPRWFASSDGAFRVDDVPAGKQFVAVSGPDLVPHALPDVSVEAARPTDLGTITVQPGRAIAGTVADREGRPVAGATVVIDREIRADGTSLVPYPRPGRIELATGPDGRFRARGIGSGKYEIAADHETAGRAPMTTIPPGTAEVQLVLTLRPPGVLQGFVRMNSKPAEAIVVLRSTDAADSRMVVRTGLDGSYRFDRVAAGRYVAITLQELRADDASADGKTHTIDVPAGGVVNHDVDLTPAGVSVMLRLTSPGNAVGYGYGFVATSDDPKMATLPLPKTISEMRASGTQISSFEIREGLLVDDRQLRLENVRPGAAVACIAPLRGHPREPAVLAELQQQYADIPLYCKWVQLPAAPALQHLTIEVQPLPARK